MFQLVFLKCIVILFFKIPYGGTSLVVQWLRIRLPTQGAWVRIPRRGTKIPLAMEQLSLCAATTEPVCHN